MRILLVEDEAMIGENIQLALEGENFSVNWARDGKSAELALAENVYDALVLDLGLPQRDGMDILRGIRSRGSSMPILITTARDTVAERVSGLKSGADDYLVKPFDLEELIARLHALIRRVHGHLEAVYRRGDITINPVTRQIVKAGHPVILSASEWVILEALVARPGVILSRGQLEERLYGLSADAESNAVEVFIHGLRKKLGTPFILNVRGVGYMVEKI